MTKQELETVLKEHDNENEHSCSFCGHKFERVRPTKDDFELDELSHQLVEAQEENSDVQLIVWKRDPVVGKILKLDGQTNLVHIENDWGTHRIPFLDILRIENS
jgi:hypothetical protein